MHYKRNFSLFPRSFRALALIIFFTVFLSLIFQPLNAQFKSVAVLGVSSVYAQEDLDLSVLEDETAAAKQTDGENPETAKQSSDADKSDEAKANGSSGRAKTLDLILASGWIGVILLICSVVAVSLIIRLCLYLRRSVFIPAELNQTLSEAIASGAYARALQIASEDNSFLGAVAEAGLKEADRGWNAVEKALEDAIDEESAKLYRRTEPLATIGNVAPMLGLLGTVVGMVTTFGELAVADVGGRNLANGIYFALVTTVDGLIVAIPILVAHSLLNSRIASLISQATASLEKVVAPLKRREPVPITPIPSVREVEPKSATRAVPNASVVHPAPHPLPSGLREVKQPETSATQQRPALSLKNRQ